MFPACYSKTQSVSSGNSSSSHPQNLITCIYQTHLFNSPTHLTLTWSKTLFSHTLTIHHPSYNSFSITISLYPTTFSFFKARPGSKSIHHTHKKVKLKLYWDFTRAKFSHNSAEPDSGFYVAVTCNGKVEFLVGDMLNELSKRAGLSLGSDLSFLLLLSRREHVFGHKSYVTKAEFNGCKHEIGIECNGGTLKLKVDDENKLIIKRLAWKFRGNERILIGGIEVEFYWDVFNWLNKHGGGGGGGGGGHGVFVFQVGDGGVWPEMVGVEKKLMRKSFSLSTTTPSTVCLSPAPSCSSVLQWAEESSDCGRSSCSSNKSCGSNGGFSLLLYAWRKD